MQTYIFAVNWAPSGLLILLFSDRGNHLLRVKKKMFEIWRPPPQLKETFPEEGNA